MNSEAHHRVLETPAWGVFVRYAMMFAGTFAVFLILTTIWSRHLAMSFDTIWRFNVVGLGAVWFIFAWAGLFVLIGKGDDYFEKKATLVGRAIWLSVNAGIWEELIFRWLVFGSAMITLTFVNWITFGLLHWLYVTLFIPVANWLTFGALAPQLLGANWILGAAVLSASASFQSGHKHLGLFGYLNAWFLGMIFFWLTFNHGIFTAMVAHVMYDLIILVAYALKSKKVRLNLQP